MLLFCNRETCLTLQKKAPIPTMIKGSPKPALPPRPAFGQQREPGAASQPVIITAVRRRRGRSVAHRYACTLPRLAAWLDPARVQHPGAASPQVVDQTRYGPPHPSVRRARPGSPYGSRSLAAICTKCSPSCGAILAIIMALSESWWLLRSRLGRIPTRSSVSLGVDASTRNQRRNGQGPGLWKSSRGTRANAPATRGSLTPPAAMICFRVGALHDFELLRSNSHHCLRQGTFSQLCDIMRHRRL